MGKLIDKIKELLFGKKMKMLPEGEEPTVNYRNSMQEFKEELSNFEEVPKVPQVNNPYIEDALTEYFNEYLKQINDMQTTGRVPDSYDVLTSINSERGDTSQNVPYENKVIGKIYQGGKYSLFTQRDEITDHVQFFHVKSNGHQLPEDKDLLRIYLNCKEENVAQLAGKLLDNNTNPNFYLKFDSTENMNIRARTEKIVIYTDEEHWQQDTQNIMNVKQMNPELFADSEKMNPFMQQYADTFCATKNQESAFYKNLQDETIQLSISSNRFISQIIQDSYFDVARNIASRDPNISFLLDESNINNYNFYIQNYPYINSVYHEELINKMEENMTILSNKNKVLIYGIQNTVPEQGINENDYNDGEHSL